MRSRSLRPHHIVWLESHPGKSRDWLRRILSEGFQVHHVDGDHANNQPANLVLMEAEDHQRLHGLFRLTKPEHDWSKLAKLGNAARTIKLSPAKRSRIARKAALSRWRGVR